MSMDGELMWNTLLRVAVAFAALLFWSRIIGKKLISHMTFFDFVAGVTFGAIGGNMIFNHTVPLWLGACALSCFSLLALLSDYISLYSWRGRWLFEGKPILVVYQGQVIPQALRQVRLTVNDLLMLLRKKNIFALEGIHCAYFETDGSVSVMKDNTTFIQPCIIDSHIMDDNLKILGRDRSWLLTKLERMNVSLEQVLLAQVDDQDQVYLYLKQKEPSRVG